MNRDLAMTLVVLMGALVLILLVALWRTRRLVLTRVRNAATRLSDDSVSDGFRVDQLLDQLDRAVDQAMVRSSDARAAETRLRRALGAIPDGVIILDDEAELVFRNSHAARFFEARHGEAVVTQVIEGMGRAALEGTPSRRTVELFGPPRRTVVITADPLDDGTRAIGSFVIIEDITERRRVDAIRRDFVSNISHELKTPVGGMSLLAETLVEEDDPEIIRRLASRVLEEAQRVSRTIDDLLELSRIEAAEVGPDAMVPVGLFLAEAVDRAASAAEQRGLRLVLVDPPHRLTVLGDRRQLTSAVFNLIDNAVKYTDPGGRVEVSARTDGQSVTITVADDGIGIPRRDVERVFERFYRVDRARSRQTGGTGLGLAIVRHVAHNHDGRIEVESREGEGSVFTLSLPAGPGPVAVSEESA